LFDALLGATFAPLPEELHVRVVLFGTTWQQL